MIKKTLLALAFLAALAVPAFAQESEISGGGGGGITAGVGSGTAGRVPQFASASSLVDSKMLTSGTNSGTWTLYDSAGSAVNSVTNFTIREGAAQAASADFTPAFQVYWANGTTRSFAVFAEGNTGYAAAMELRYVSNTDAYFRLSPNEGLTFRNVSGAANQGVYWSDGSPGAPDLGLLKHSAGTAKFSDGSTGFGSLRVAAVGAETVNGAVANVQTVSESITLAAAATTDSTADLCPANSVILSVTWRITTSIAGVDSTTLSVGDPTTAARFGTGTVLTAGTTGIGITHMSGASVTAATGPTQGTAAKLRLTLSGGADNVPSGGVVRVTVTYLSLTPPTS